MYGMQTDHGLYTSVSKSGRSGRFRISAVELLARSAQDVSQGFAPPCHLQRALAAFLIDSYRLGVSVCQFSGRFWLAFGCVGSLSQEARAEEAKTKTTKSRPKVTDGHRVNRIVAARILRWRR